MSSTKKFPDDGLHNYQEQVRDEMDRRTNAEDRIEARKQNKRNYRLGILAIIVAVLIAIIEYFK